jgi:predicted GIY-YIG superfamily endonuclease
MMALDYYRSFSTGFLTESFRFNQGIADKANVVLKALGSEMKIVGSGKKTVCDSKAILCRTNASVVASIFENLPSGKKIYTSINISEVFSKLFHIEACFFNKPPKYPCKELSHIVDKETLAKAIEFSEDLRRLMDLGKSLVKNQTLWQAKKMLEDRIVKTIEEAEIVITTIHGSKGLEFSDVTIDDDFLAIQEGESTQDAVERLMETESLLCLLYVAITRAEVVVEIPWYLESMFEEWEEENETEYTKEYYFPEDDFNCLEEETNPFERNYTVYFLYNSSEELLFIGVTVNLKNRLKQHWKADKWYSEIDGRKTKKVVYRDRPSGYTGRKKALEESSPKYSEIYKTKVGWSDDGMVESEIG